MRRIFVVASVLLGFAAVLGIYFFGWTTQTTEGQERENWTPCGCFCGFEPPYPPVPPDPYRIFNNQPCTGILSADACSEGLSNLPADQLAAVCERVKATKGFRTFKDSCPVFEKFCETKCPAGQQKYSGTISCDCNGDGSDDNTKSFESCGPPSSFPQTFRSRCEDWATGDGGYSYGTDIRIQRAGAEWLQKTYCPANDCHQQHAKCTGPLETELQKCTTGRRLLGRGTQCQRYYQEAKARCDNARTACLSKAGGRPGPQPQPVPTPTPPSVNAYSLLSLRSGAANEWIWPVDIGTCAAAS
jgi:hypothetical protein